MTMTPGFGAPNPGYPYHMERKLKKPLMEKRRRARINQCLTELKNLLLQAAPHQRSKLEKADILEMTVQHLRKLNSDKPPCDESTLRHSYVDGYSACANTVMHYLQTVPDTSQNDHLRLGIAGHLQGFLSERVKCLPSSQWSGPESPEMRPVPLGNVPQGFPGQLSVSIPTHGANSAFQTRQSGLDLPTPPYGYSNPAYSNPNYSNPGFCRVPPRLQTGAPSPSPSGSSASSLSPVSSGGCSSVGLGSPTRDSPRKPMVPVWRPW